MRSVPESVWKLFRQFHPLALERFCQRVLDEVADQLAVGTLSAHDKYLAVYQLIERRDAELAAMFNELSRSTAFSQLAHLRARRLLSDSEFAQFSQSTREHVDAVLDRRRNGH